MSVRNIRRKERQRGLASVEMALVTPALLFVMLAAGEFTRVFYDYNTLTKTVRDAARMASLRAIDGGGAVDYGGEKYTRAQIENVAVTGRLSGGTALLPGLTTADVDVTTTGPVGRPYIVVSATYTFRPLAPVLDGLGFANSTPMNFTLRASSTMRAQK